ncbi:MAG: D-alanyl-D-alanine carboxypeptidase [Streptosporangiales bacterium]|nr:D-alanyl-D-alanine carboxypeptidase [Streptosporangiales bacterium]
MTGVVLAAACIAPMGTAPMGTAHADPGNAVGGPLLGRDTTVVQRAPGVPGLPRVSAESYVVSDLDTGKVLAAKDAHGHHLPASTLKMLTAVALIPKLDPDKKVKPSWKACNIEGTAVGIKDSMSYKVSDLFYGMLMVSGNDAATALAEAGGGVKKTLRLMNAEAQRLRAYDTVAKTVSGLDGKGQRSSAYDLSLIAREGLKNEAFRDYVSRRTMRFPAPRTKADKKAKRKSGGYQIQNHNRLFTTHDYDGAYGVKNGWTSKANGSFVGVAERDGHSVMVALMNSEAPFWDDTEQLLSWGFKARGKVTPVGELVPPRPRAQPRTAVGGGKQAKVTPPQAVNRGDESSFPVLPVGLGVLGAAGLGAFLYVRRAPR